MDPRPLIVGPSLAIRWTQILLGACLAAAFSPAGNGTVWRAAPSLAWLHQALPWMFFSVMFAAYAVLLAMGRHSSIVAGNALGVGLFGLETFALFVTGFKPQNPGNPMVVAAMVLAVVLHARALTVAATMAARKASSADEP